MGYKPPKTVFKLDFSATEYAGLEVAVRAGSIGKLLGLQELADQDALTAAEARQMFAGFAELLVSWNVEDDDGKPVPAAYEGVAAQEVDFIKAIITAYFETTAAAPPPLPGTSASGGNSPVAALAAASQSLSPGS